ncbi:MAG: response regulator [Leptospirales bacterium]|nr:response regulator [Leptospirales bacterium]
MTSHGLHTSLEQVFSWITRSLDPGRLALALSTVLLTLLLTPTLEASPVRLEPGVPLPVPDLEVFLDHTGELAFDQVQTATFTRVSGNSYVEGFSGGTLWVRFETENTGHPADWLLVQGYAAVQNMELFGKGQTGLRTGMAVPVSERALKERQLILPLKCEGKQTWYLRVWGETALRVRLHVMDRTAFEQFDRAGILTLAIYAGSCLGLTVFAWVAALLDRNAGFMLFGLSLFFGIVLVLCQWGFVGFYLVPQNPQLAIILNAAGPGLFALFTIEFTRKFLSARTVSRIYNRVLMGISALGLCMALYSIFKPGLITMLNNFLIVLLLLSLTMLTVLAIRHGVKSARYFFAGSMFYITSAIPYFLRVFGIVQGGFWSDYGTLFGGFVYALVLAGGLIDRLRSLAGERASLETVARERAEFFAMMSHEIRTPMNGVIWMTDLLNSGSLTPSQQPIVNALAESARSLLRIINDFLDFSRLQSVAFKVEATSFDIRQLLNGVRDALASLAENRGITIETVVDPSLPERLSGDELRLRQILLNLGSNGLKFTDKGKITISLDLLAADDERMQVEFSVRDTGRGIPQDRIGDLFKPFVRLHPESMAVGTGLGLAIANKLVEHMGGKIEVESEVDVGSVFRFGIWLHWSNELPVEKVTSTEVYEFRVLVAEDNEINRMVAQTLFQSLGMSVELVENGREALDKLEKETYDLVFLDLQMPVMDGETAAAHIRRLYKGLYIVALTANAETSIVADGLADELLLKPLTVDAARQVLETFRETRKN